MMVALSEDGPIAKTSLMPGSMAQALQGSRGEASQRLIRLLDRAGWALDWLDIDLTGRSPKLEIRVSRYDGLWISARLDQLGRTTLDRFHRDRWLGMPSNNKKGARSPLSPQVEDTFLGRQKLGSAQKLLEALSEYLVDNALHPISLADMKSAWIGLTANAGQKPNEQASVAMREAPINRT